MPQVGKSAKLYMERKIPHLQGTLRGPGPQLYLADNPAHKLKLEPPLPNPAYFYNRKYVDGGKTRPWPSGNIGQPPATGVQSGCSNCQ